MLTALMITKVVSESHQSLPDLAALYHKSPQIIVNLSATPEQKSALKSSDQVKELLLTYSKKLEPLNGRLLVRPSGTEPLIRITMWGNDESAIANLANTLKDQLGAIL